MLAFKACGSQYLEKLWVQTHEQLDTLTSAENSTCSGFAFEPAELFMLHARLEAEQVPILAALAKFEEDKNEDDLDDTLLRLALAWPRTLSPPLQRLCVLLRGLEHNHLISAMEERVLRGLVCAHNEVLMAAFSILEADFSRLPWLSFWDTLVRLLRRRWRFAWSPVHGAVATLLHHPCSRRVLERHPLGNEIVASVPHKPAQGLTARAREMISVLAAGRWLTEADRRHLSQLLKKRNVVFFAALAEYEETKDVQELIDSMLRLASRWRLNCSRDFAGILLLADHLSSRGSLGHTVHDAIELLVFERNRELQEAFLRFEGAQDEKKRVETWQLFWAKVTELCTRRWSPRPDSSSS